jgi:aryl-alcohol dehydrogenase-like predicted oxidoreductase
MDFHDGAELLRRAVDAGINLFDVGVYGKIAPHPGSRRYHSFTDVIFGRLLRHVGIPREGVVLSEKLWLDDWPGQSMRGQLEAALDRVGTDYADLAIVGDVRVAGTDLEGVVVQLAELIGDGRLRGWGVNNWAVQDIRRVHAFAQREGLPGPQVAQLKYSLARRAVADGDAFRELVQETGIGLQASDVLEGGILAGRLQPDRGIGTDPGGIRELIRAAAPRVAGIATELGATPAQLAIAFCLTHPATVTVLFGATSLGQLEDNLGALELLAHHGDVLRDRVAELWLDRDR